ncbi:MAG: hypothetical protein M1830_000167 [Pleopsidium flavum]|nr:MAG: hypothetical protein M1830_000167 [Pleopsidium flavum]
MHITDEQTSRQEKEGEGEREAAGQAFSPLHEVVFVTLLCCTQLITQSAFGSVLVPLQLIGLSFDSNSVGQRSWFLAAYSLTVGTFVLVAGQLGDIYGHKKMLVGGWFWFGLWSLIAGLSAYTSSTIFFDVCRALQGIGPAFLLPNGLAILSGAYPPGRRKEMVFAFFAAMAPVGFVVGAVFGSLFAQLVWWPWGFYCTAIVCVMISLLAYVVIPARDAAPEREVKEAFDLVGAVFGVVGLVLVNFAWNQATVVGWTTSYTYATLILGIVSLTIFGFHERKTPNPLLPMDIWNGSAICIIACLGLGWSSFGVWVFYTYQVIEVLRDVTPLAAAAQFVPEMISGIVAAITTGYLLSRVPTTWMMVVASTAFFIGCLLSATAPVRQTYWANIFVSMMVMAWG